jgi:hypothetical protein
METVGIFCGRLEYFTAMCYILWPLGNLVVIWYIFFPFWYSVSRKIWQPWSAGAQRLISLQVQKSESALKIRNVSSGANPTKPSELVTYETHSFWLQLY